MFSSSDWERVRLGDVSHIVMGQSPPSETYNSEGYGLYFLQGKAEFTEISPKPSKYCSKPLKTAKKGSVLISVRAPVGDVNVADQEYCIGRGITSISLTSGSNWFLFYLLKSMKDEIQSKASGTTFQSINKTTIENFEIPFPPDPEQRAIARALRAAQEAKAARRREIGLEQEHKAALMGHLFARGTRVESTKQTEIGEIPQSWLLKELGDIFDVQQGVALSPKRRKGISPHPFLRTSNVMWGRIDLSAVDQMDFTLEETTKLKLKRGDLLVCEGGDVGRTAMWNEEIPLCCYQNHIHRLRQKQECEVVPEFYMYWMQAAFLLRGLYLSQANTTTIANLSGSRLKSFKLPFPSADQKKIASVLSACDSKISALHDEIKVLDELFTVMLQEFVTGRLSSKPLIEIATP